MKPPNLFFRHNSLPFGRFSTGGGDLFFAHLPAGHSTGWTCGQGVAAGTRGWGFPCKFPGAQPPPSSRQVTTQQPHRQEQVKQHGRAGPSSAVWVVSGTGLSLGLIRDWGRLAWIEATPSDHESHPSSPWWLRQSSLSDFLNNRSCCRD